MKNIAIFIISRNAYNMLLLEKLENMIKLDIECYLISDILPEKISDEISKKIIQCNLKENIIHYTDEFMVNNNWIKSSIKKPVTGWDKALYHAYTLKKDFNWFIEDDVYWNNDQIMKDFFIMDDKSDLITNQKEKKTDYLWFLYLNTNKLTVDKNIWKTTFNPICRLSYKILEKINEYSHIHDTLIFHEIMFATICQINNYNILFFKDIELEYSLKIIIEWRNESISNNEINILINENKNVLLHPVKIN